LKVDVRVVAATNRNLADLVANGTFREDLYYRIRVVPITLPPLCDRRPDIPLLVDHFIQKLSAKTGKPIRSVSPEAMEVLYDREYPGNIRELENALQRAFVLCHGSRIEISHLPRDWVRHNPTSTLAGHDAIGARNAGLVTVASEEQRRSAAEPAPLVIRLAEALQAHQWNRTATARALGIGRNTLWRWMKEQGLLR
jgi:DNA-binding NtrC family response regulator